VLAGELGEPLVLEEQLDAKRVGHEHAALLHARSTHLAHGRQQVLLPMPAERNIPRGTAVGVAGRERVAPCKFVQHWSLGDFVARGDIVGVTSLHPSRETHPLEK